MRDPSTCWQKYTTIVRDSIYIQFNRVNFQWLSHEWWNETVKNAYSQQRLCKVVALGGKGGRLGGRSGLGLCQRTRTNRNDSRGKTLVSFPKAIWREWLTSSTNDPLILENLSTRRSMVSSIIFPAPLLSLTAFISYLVDMGI